MTDFDYDVLVIGSGFGGSVSALRFVEKGYRVLVVEKGKLAGVGAHSYTAGDATKGSEEAAKFKK